MSPPRATHVAVADTTSDTSNGAGSTGATSRPRSVPPGQQIADTVQMVKDYARQETLDPIRIAGKWIAFGLVGAVLIGSGTLFLALGILRMMQTEWPDTFDGRWMKMLPYAAALLFSVIVIVLAALRINKDPLSKEKR